MRVRTIHLQVKIKTLAAEGRIIRVAERKALTRSRQLGESNRTAFHSLRDHRVGIVRETARLNLLAYGFLRGRSYASMEARTRVAPNFKEIEKIAARFADTWDAAAWQSWLSTAQAYIAAQPPKPVRAKAERASTVEAA